MKINQAGLDLIKHWEGCKLKAYKDQAGVITAGYGHTGPDINMKTEWTQEQAEDALKTDIVKFESKLIALTSDLPSVLTLNQFSALIAFIFNLGTGALAGSTLLKLLKAGTPAFKVAAEFAKWNKVRINGKLVESKGLTNRRKAEAELFLKAD